VFFTTVTLGICHLLGWQPLRAVPGIVWSSGGHLGLSDFSQQLLRAFSWLHPRIVLLYEMLCM
jgi:hypothetical protein